MRAGQCVAIRRINNAARHDHSVSFTLHRWLMCSHHHGGRGHGTGAERADRHQLSAPQ
jgi:hypothetical protein